MNAITFSLFVLFILGTFVLGIVLLTKKNSFGWISFLASILTTALLAYNVYTPKLPEEFGGGARAQNIVQEEPIAVAPPVIKEKKRDYLGEAREDLNRSSKKLD